MQTASFLPAAFFPLERGARLRLAARAAAALLSMLVLASLYWAGAAAGFSGLIGKWGLNDENAAAEACAATHRAGHGCEANYYDLASMLNGSATRPWAYRVLVPWTANFIDRHAHGPVVATSVAVSQFLGQRRIENFSPSKAFVKTTEAKLLKYQTRYAIVYYISFLSIFAFTFLMRQVLHLLGYNPLVSAVAPFAFVVAWPYLMTVNGHYYDASELMFMALAMLCALSRRSLWLPVVAVLGSLNKETFLIFVAALAPFYLGRGRTIAAAMLSISVLMCVAVNIYVRWIYAGLPGAGIEWHALENLKDYSSPWIYHQAELTYGVIGPQGVFVGSILVMGYICAAGWSRIDRRMQAHIVLSAVFNIPLLLLFCVSGELRNLSFLFIGFVVLMAQVFDNRLKAPVTSSAAAPTNAAVAAAPLLLRDASAISTRAR